MAGKHSLLTASIAATGVGDNTISTAAVAGKTVYVVTIALVASAANVVLFKSGSNALTGGMSMAANGGFTVSAAGDDSYLFRTNPGEALILNQTANGAGGFITYYIA